MAVLCSQMWLMLLLSASAATSGIAPDQIWTVPKAKPGPPVKVTYPLVNKRSAEFVPSDRVYAHKTSFFSKRLPVPFQAYKEDRRTVPNIYPGLQIIASLTGSLNQLRVRNAQRYPTVTSDGSPKDLGHTNTKTQADRNSREDSELSPPNAVYNVDEDIRNSSSKDPFLLKLFAKTVKTLYLFTDPITYPISV